VTKVVTAIPNLFRLLRVLAMHFPTEQAGNLCASVCDLSDCVSDRHGGSAGEFGELSVAGDQLETVLQLQVADTEKRRL